MRWSFHSDPRSAERVCVAACQNGGGFLAPNHECSHLCVPRAGPKPRAARERPLRVLFVGGSTNGRRSKPASACLRSSGRGPGAGHGYGHRCGRGRHSRFPSGRAAYRRLGAVTAGHRCNRGIGRRCTSRGRVSTGEQGLLIGARLPSELNTALLPYRGFAEMSQSTAACGR